MWRNSHSQCCVYCNFLPFLSVLNNLLSLIEQYFLNYTEIWSLSLSLIGMYVEKKADSTKSKRSYRSITDTIIRLSIWIDCVFSNAVFIQHFKKLLTDKIIYICVQGNSRIILVHYLLLLSLSFSFIKISEKTWP